ncbi:Outer membrane protein (porin) [Marinobacter sp. LV10R510-11A]|uniref:porin n=1 Tax=Marinobacter sp. LV10R510-11A TaxID=1415568 RepID=UPI000BB79038|nr:porin [Marinobacter sp. LV10R510-11A]SOB76701.1 Outer membrane protein (porin) [Marinobacter sp. LV10R510-11A]
MKKTLIASAIAAISFSGAVAAEMPEPAMSILHLTEKMDAMPNFYGNIQYVYTYSDSDVNGSGGQHADNGTTLGFTHDHQIAPGIEGFMRVELEVRAADEKGPDNGLVDMDEAYIGVRGDSFGQVWIGSDDTQYESLLGDYGNWVFEYAGLNPYASYTTGEGDMLQYASPSFGGLTLHAGVQIQGASDASYPGGDEKRPYQLAASYSVDALTLSFVMDSNDGAADTSNENSYGLSAEYALGSLVLDAYYDTRKGVDGFVDGDGTGGSDDQKFSLEGEEGRDQFGVMATYSMGANTFRAAYEMASADTSDLDVDVITLQALHNVSDHLYVYTELAQRNNDNGTADEEINQINVGGVYYF